MSRYNPRTTEAIATWLETRASAIEASSDHTPEDPAQVFRLLAGAIRAEVFAPTLPESAGEASAPSLRIRLDECSACPFELAEAPGAFGALGKRYDRVAVFVNEQHAGELLVSEGTGKPLADLLGELIPAPVGASTSTKGGVDHGAPSESSDRGEKTAGATPGQSASVQNGAPSTTNGQAAVLDVAFKVGDRVFVRAQRSLTGPSAACMGTVIEHDAELDETYPLDWRVRADDGELMWHHASELEFITSDPTPTSLEQEKTAPPTSFVDGYNVGYNDHSQHRPYDPEKAQKHHPFAARAGDASAPIRRSRAWGESVLLGAVKRMTPAQRAAYVSCATPLTTGAVVAMVEPRTSEAQSEERAALTADPDAPFSTLTTAGLADLEKSFDDVSWSDHKLSVLTLIAEVRYLRKLTVRRSGDDPTRTSDQQQILDLKAENRQLRADIEAESAGNASLRERFGALEHETFPAFVERLAAGAPPRPETLSLIQPIIDWAHAFQIPVSTNAWNGLRARLGTPRRESPHPDGTDSAKVSTAPPERQPGCESVNHPAPNARPDPDDVLTACFRQLDAICRWLAEVGEDDAAKTLYEGRDRFLLPLAKAAVEADAAPRPADAPSLDSKLDAQRECALEAAALIADTDLAWGTAKRIRELKTSRDDDEPRPLSQAELRRRSDAGDADRAAARSSAEAQTDEADEARELVNAEPGEGLPDAILRFGHRVARGRCVCRFGEDGRAIDECVSHAKVREELEKLRAEKRTRVESETEQLKPIAFDVVLYTRPNDKGERQHRTVRCDSATRYGAVERFWKAIETAGFGVTITPAQDRERGPSCEGGSSFSRSSSSSSSPATPSPSSCATPDACEGVCGNLHRGDVYRVRVSRESFFAEYNYCEAARDQDRANGYAVDAIESGTTQLRTKGFAPGPSEAQRDPEGRVIVRVPEPPQAAGPWIETPRSGEARRVANVDAMAAVHALVAGDYVAASRREEFLERVAKALDVGYVAPRRESARQRETSAAANVSRSEKPEETPNACVECGDPVPDFRVGRVSDPCRASQRGLPCVAARSSGKTDHHGTPAITFTSQDERDRAAQLLMVARGWCDGTQVRDDLLSKARKYVDAWRATQATRKAGEP